MDFSPQRNGWFDLFFLNFCNRDPFLMVFYVNNDWFYKFLAIFVKWDPLLRIFWPKWNTCLRIFGEKVTHFSGTSPYALTHEYLPVPTPRHFDSYWVFYAYRVQYLKLALTSLRPCSCWACTPRASSKMQTDITTNLKTYTLQLFCYLPLLLHLTCLQLGIHLCK